MDRVRHHLRSSELEIEYAEGEAGGAAAENTLGGQVRMLRARGSVLLTSDDNQTVTGDRAEFDVLKDRATVSGHVVVTQGKNVLKGEKLVIDMKTGQTFFDTGSTAVSAGGTGKACPPGRICAVFVPSQAAGAGKTGKPAPRAPARTGSSGWSTRSNLGGPDLRHLHASE